MKQKGFVLIAVLGLLMVLALIASFIASYAEQRLDQTFQLRQQLQSQLDSDATLATLLYVIATRPLVQNAYLLQVPPTDAAAATSSFDAPPLLDISQLPRLTLEGQRYQGLGQTAFSLQDEGSLLSLLDPDRERWTDLFRQHSLTRQQADSFLNQLLDYTDHDDLRRLNGANASDYISAGLAPPPQRPMISPGQVFNLLDGTALQADLYTMLPLMTTRSGQLNNLNTSPKVLLQSLPGIDSALAQLIVDERKKKPFTDLADANRRLGHIIPIDPLEVPSQASPYIRIQLWADRRTCRQPIWLGLSSTPASVSAPWEIDYTFVFNQEQPCPALQQLVLPPLF